jgi:hypothetical protein
VKPSPTVRANSASGTLPPSLSDVGRVSGRGATQAAGRADAFEPPAGPGPAPAPSPRAPFQVPPTPVESGSSSGPGHAGGGGSGGFMGERNGPWRPPEFCGRLCRSGEQVVARPVTITVPPG